MLVAFRIDLKDADFLSSSCIHSQHRPRKDRNKATHQDMADYDDDDELFKDL
jgi:hypothetical protein